MNGSNACCCSRWIHEDCMEDIVRGEDIARKNLSYMSF